MSIPVIMPKQGQSVETCIITKWLKHKGEEVKTGEILFSYETDKAAFDVESPADGTILEIYYSDGAEVPVLVTVAIIGHPGEETGQIIPDVSTESNKSVRIQGIPGRIRISPRAKRYAQKNNLIYDNIQGSGPNGRIICGDIDSALSGTTAAVKEAGGSGDEFTEMPLTNVRKLTAKAMHDSLLNSAQITHHMSADVRNILEARKKIKLGLKDGSQHQDITLNDMICLCVARAINKFPAINSHFLGDRLRVFKKVHLGFAVDTSRGLLVPVIKNADEMTLPELSGELKYAADACKKGTVNPELILNTAASFTVTNLGNYGVEMFTPIINLPQIAILGICTIINRPADLGNGIFGFVPYVGLSLTYDHRAIDGGPATLFLREIKEQIERFSY